MRILFDNYLAKYAVDVSGTNINGNFPETNLYDQILQTVMQTDAGFNITTITITLDAPRTVSALAVGFHNLNTMDVVYKDNGGGTIATENYVFDDLWFDPVTPNAIQYTGPHANVLTIEVTATSLTIPLYIGGLWFGQYLQMPFFDNGPTLGLTTTSSLQVSRSGASFGVPGFVLATFECTFSGVLLDDANAIRALFEAVQNDKPVWLDRWEDSGEFPPLYATQTNEITATKAGDSVAFNDLTLAYKEIR